MERSGAEWSGVEQSGAGRRINSSGGDLKQEQRTIVFNIIRDIV